MGRLSHGSTSVKRLRFGRSSLPSRWEIREAEDGGKNGRSEREGDIQRQSLEVALAMRRIGRSQITLTENERDRPGNAAHRGDPRSRFRNKSFYDLRTEDDDGHEGRPGDDCDGVPASRPGEPFAIAVVWLADADGADEENLRDE